MMEKLKFTINSVINTHKILVSPLMILLMWHYQNWSTAAFLYLGLHGTYTILWIIKQNVFPDKNWEEKIPWWIGIILFALLSTYYVAPYLLISQHTIVPMWVFALAPCIFTFGIFFHFVGDAQKYFVLKERKGLIDDGLFKRTRNPNYLGEILIYIGLTLNSWHWFPLVLFSGWILFFIFNMNKKDKSMSRYMNFKLYKAKTGQLLPRIF